MNASQEKELQAGIARDDSVPHMMLIDAVHIAQGRPDIYPPATLQSAWKTLRMAGEQPLADRVWIAIVRKAQAVQSQQVERPEPQGPFRFDEATSVVRDRHGFPYASVGCHVRTEGRRRAGLRIAEALNGRDRQDRLVQALQSEYVEQDEDGSPRVLARVG